MPKFVKSYSLKADDLINLEKTRCLVDIKSVMCKTSVHQHNFRGSCYKCHHTKTKASAGVQTAWI